MTEMRIDIMELKIIDITPDMANEMLQYNTCNRSLSKNTVSKYVNMMRQGEWYLSHQAIAFTTGSDGNLVLVDGQHRLAAVIQSGMTIKFSVIYNAVQTPYIDTVRNRTFIDNLNIYNNTTRYTKNMMSIYNLLMSIIKSRKNSQVEHQLFCDYYYDTFTSIEKIYKNSKTKSGGCPLKTALFIAINENPQQANLLDKLANYMYIFNTGNVSADDDNGSYVKEMRDHYYLLNREFSSISSVTSFSVKRKKLTSIFLYSIESYINEQRYLPSINMEDRLCIKVERQMSKITYDNK